MPAWWFDDQIDPEEIKQLAVTRLVATRNMHAIMNSIKIVQCIACERETPSLSTKKGDILVLQLGEKIKMEDKEINNFVKSSEVLSNSVQLHPFF